MRRIYYYYNNAYGDEFSLDGNITSLNSNSFRMFKGYSHITKDFPVAIYTKSGNFVMLSLSDVVVVPYSPNKTMYFNFRFDALSKKSSLSVMNHWVPSIPILFGVDVFYDKKMVNIYKKSIASDTNIYQFEREIFPYVNTVIDNSTNMDMGAFWFGISNLPIEIISEAGMMYRLHDVIDTYDSVNVNDDGVNNINPTYTGEAFPVYFIIVPGSYEIKDVIVVMPLYSPFGVWDTISSMMAVAEYAQLTPKYQQTIVSKPRNTSPILINQPNSYFDIKFSTYWYCSGVGGCGEPIFQLKTIGKLVQFWHTVRINHEVDNLYWPLSFVVTKDNVESGNLIPSYDVWTKLDNYLKIEGPFFIKIGCDKSYSEMTNSQNNAPNFQYVCDNNGRISGDFYVMYGCLPFTSLIPDISGGGSISNEKVDNKFDPVILEDKNHIYNSVLYPVGDRVAYLNVLNTANTVGGSPYNCHVKLSTSGGIDVNCDSILANSDAVGTYAIANMPVNYRTIPFELNSMWTETGYSSSMVITNNKDTVECLTTPKVITHFKGSKYPILPMCIYYEDGNLRSYADRLPSNVNGIIFNNKFVTSREDNKNGDEFSFEGGLVDNIDIPDTVVPFQISVDYGLLDIESIVRRVIISEIREYVNDNNSLSGFTANDITTNVDIPFILGLVDVGSEEFNKMMNLSNYFGATIGEIFCEYSFDGNNTPINKYLHNKIHNNEDLDFFYIIGKYTVELTVGVKQSIYQFGNNVPYNSDVRIEFHEIPFSIDVDGIGYLNTTIFVVEEVIQGSQNFYVYDFKYIYGKPISSEILFGMKNNGHLSVPSIYVDNDNNTWFYNNKYIMKYKEENGDKIVEFYSIFLDSIVEKTGMGIDNLQIYELADIRYMDKVSSWMQYLGKLKI